MKDELFEKKLEALLETLYQIDMDVKKYLNELEKQNYKHHRHYFSGTTKSSQSNYTITK